MFHQQDQPQRQRGDQFLQNDEEPFQQHEQEQPEQQPEENVLVFNQIDLNDPENQYQLNSENTPLFSRNHFIDTAIDWLLVHEIIQRNSNNSNNNQDAKSKKKTTIRTNSNNNNTNANNSRYVSECAGFGGETEISSSSSSSSSAFSQHPKSVCWFLLEPRNRILIEGDYGVIVASDGIVRDVLLIPDVVSSNLYFFVCIASSDGTYIQRVAPGGQTSLLFQSSEPTMGIVDFSSSSSNNNNNSNRAIGAVLENGDVMVINLSSFPCQVVHRVSGNPAVAKVTPGWLASSLSYLPRFGNQIREAVTIQPVIAVAASQNKKRFAVLRHHSVQVWDIATCKVVAEKSLLRNPSLVSAADEDDATAASQNENHQLTFTGVSMSFDGEFVAVVRDFDEETDLAQKMFRIDDQDIVRGKTFQNHGDDENNNNDNNNEAIDENACFYYCDDSYLTGTPTSLHNAPATAIDIFQLVGQHGIYDRPLHLAHESVFFVPIKHVQRVSIFSEATIVVSGSRRLCIGAFRDSFVDGRRNNRNGASNKKTYHKVKLLFDKSIPHESPIVSVCRPTETISGIFGAVHDNDFLDDAGCFVRILDINFELRVDFLGLPAAALRRFSRLINQSLPSLDSNLRHQRRLAMEHNPHASRSLASALDENTADSLRGVFANCFRAFMVRPPQQKEGNVNHDDDNNNNNNNVAMMDENNLCCPPVACQLLLRAMASLRIRRHDFPEQMIKKEQQHDYEPIFAFLRAAILPLVNNRQAQNHPVRHPVARVHFSIVAAALKREFDQIERHLENQWISLQQQMQDTNIQQQQQQKQDLLMPLANYCDELIKLCSVDIGNDWFDPAAAAITLEPKIISKDVNGAVVALQGPNDQFCLGDAVTLQAMFLHEVVHIRGRNITECLFAVHALNVICEQNNNGGSPRKNGREQSPSSTMKMNNNNNNNMFVDPNAMPRMIHDGTRHVLPSFLRQLLVNFNHGNNNNNNSNLPSSAVRALRPLLSPAGNLEIDVWELLYQNEFDAALDTVEQNILDLYTLDRGEPLGPITNRLVEVGTPEFAEIKIALSLVEKRPSSVGRERARARGFLITALEKTAKSLMDEFIERNNNNNNNNNDGDDAALNATDDDDGDHERLYFANEQEQYYYASFYALTILRPMFIRIWQVVSDDEDAHAVMNWLIQFAISKPALEIAALASEDIIMRHFVAKFLNQNNNYDNNFNNFNNNNNSTNTNNNNMMSPHAAWWLFKNANNADAAANALCNVVANATNIPLSPTRIYLAQCAVECAQSPDFKNTEQLPRVLALQQHVLAQESLMKCLKVVDEHSHSIDAAENNNNNNEENSGNNNINNKNRSKSNSRTHSRSNSGGVVNTRVLTGNGAAVAIYMSSDILSNVRSFERELELGGSLLALNQLRQWCGQYRRIPGVGSCELQILKARVSMVSAISNALQHQVQQQQNYQLQRGNTNNMNNDGQSGDDESDYDYNNNNTNNNNNILAQLQQQQLQRQLSEEQERYNNIAAWCGAFEAAVMNPLPPQLLQMLFSSNSEEVAKSNAATPASKRESLANSAANLVNDDSATMISPNTNNSNSRHNPLFYASTHSNMFAGSHNNYSYSATQSPLLNRCVEVVNALGKIHGVSLPFIVSFVEAVSGNNNNNNSNSNASASFDNNNNGIAFLDQSQLHIARCKAYTGMGITAPLIIQAVLTITDAMAMGVASGNLATTPLPLLQQQQQQQLGSSSNNTPTLKNDASQNQHQNYTNISSFSEAFALTRVSAADLFLRCAKYFSELPADTESMRRSFAALDARVKKMYANARTGSRTVSHLDRLTLEEANRTLLQSEAHLLEMDEREAAGGFGRSKSYIF